MTKKLIGIDRFQTLSLREQLDVLHKDGVHVGKRLVENKTIILYQINGFYAEVYFESYRKKVEQILVSDSVDVIRPYLGQINVRDLDDKKNME